MKTLKYWFNKHNDYVVKNWYHVKPQSQLDVRFWNFIQFFPYLIYRSINKWKKDHPWYNTNWSYQNWCERATGCSFYFGYVITVSFLCILIFSARLLVSLFK